MAAGDAYFYDTDQGAAVTATIQLESYGQSPSDAVCIYSSPVQSVTDALGVDVTASFTLLDYQTGQISFVWDGITAGIVNYVWQIDSINQAFSINYASGSGFDCLNAVWQSNTASPITHTELFGDQGQLIYPDYTTDQEIASGSTTVCGDKNIWVEYSTVPGMVSGWLTLDQANGIMQIAYTDQKMLGLNTASLRIEYIDYPDNPGISFSIQVQVDCPLSHTSIISPFNNTLSEDPTFYYDITLGQTMTVALNFWQIAPLDTLENINCFFDIAHRFYDVTDAAAAPFTVNYITEVNFGDGLVLIDQTDPSFIGTTKVYEWRIDIDDGTADKLIQTFTVIYEGLVDCSQTSLQQNWPWIIYSQMFFEPIPQRFALIQPTNSLSELQNDPSFCGALTYRFTDYYDTTVSIPWMFIDQATMEFYMDVQPLYEDIFPQDRTPILMLEVSLVDWPDVTPVFQVVAPTILCPTQHSTFQILGTPRETLVYYDVTDAMLQEFVMHNIEVKPEECFTTTSNNILDANGVAQSYANPEKSYICQNDVYSCNKLLVDMQGVKAWEWLTQPITLHWSATLSDGTQHDDIMVLTVQGTSTCSGSTFDTYLPSSYTTLPEQVPAIQWSYSNVFDTISLSKGVAAPYDYCGPHIVTVTQIESDGSSGPLTRGTLFQSGVGDVLIDFNVATHQDAGIVTFQVETSLQYFPEVVPAIHTVTIEYLCPPDSLFEIAEEMPVTSFQYHVASQETLLAQLSQLLLSACHSTTRQAFIRADTGSEVNFISAIQSTNQLSLFTPDLDQQLRGTTVDFIYIVDLSDGRTNLEAGSFSVEFIGLNNLPYFSPPLTSVLQIYKQPNPFVWEFELPNYLDDDVYDVLTISVDLQETESFMSYQNGIFIIDDISSEQVPTGTFNIIVILSDGKESIIREISVIIHAAPVFEDQPEEGDESSTNSSEDNQDTDIEVTSEEEDSVIEEEETNLESNETNNATDDSTDVPIQTQVFDWVNAFKRKADLMKKSGEFDTIKPPEPRLQYIQQTGEVQISFDQDMQVLPKLEMITEGTVLINGQTKPVLEINVIASAYQDPQKLDFEWVTSGMTKRSVKFQLQFKTAVYVSSQDESDLLRVIFRDPYLFVGQNNLAISKNQKKRRRNLRREMQDYSDFYGSESYDNEEIVLERELPTQMQLGGTEETVQDALSSASDGSKVAMASNFVMNILISASLNQLWAMINTQQLIVMMPLFQISMPSNAGQFFKQIMEIAAFDFFDFTDIIHEQFQIEPTDPIDSNFETVGFESQYFLVNMGTMVVFYMIYISCLLIAPFLRTCRGMCKCMKRSSKKLDRSIYWNSLITLINESYMIIVVCVLINIKIFSMENTGLKVMSILCAIFLFFSVTLPILFVYAVKRNWQNLNEPDVQVKYHSIYEELRLRSGQKVLLVPSFFLLRRMLLAIAICAVGKVFIWQIAIMSGQIIMQAIILGMGVFESKKKTQMEFFNEMILMFTMYTIICFSPFGPDAETRFYIGYVTITIVCLHLIVNLFTIFKTTIIAMKTKCRMKLVKKKLRRQRQIVQERLAKLHDVRKQKALKMREEANEEAKNGMIYDLSFDQEQEDSIDDQQALVKPEQISAKKSKHKPPKQLLDETSQKTKSLLLNANGQLQPALRIKKDKGISLQPIAEVNADDDRTPRHESEKKLISSKHTTTQSPQEPVNLDEFEADLKTQENQIEETKKQIRDETLQTIETDLNKFFLKGEIDDDLINKFDTSESNNPLGKASATTTQGIYGSYANMIKIVPEQMDEKLPQISRDDYQKKKRRVEISKQFDYATIADAVSYEELQANKNERQPELPEWDQRFYPMSQQLHEENNPNPPDPRSRSGSSQHDQSAQLINMNENKSQMLKKEQDIFCAGRQSYID